jgi:hypothetical protein
VMPSPAATATPLGPAPTLSIIGTYAFGSGVMGTDDAGTAAETTSMAVSSVTIDDFFMTYPQKASAGIMKRYSAVPMDETLKSTVSGSWHSR